jgi:hypothetical protein
MKYKVLRLIKGENLGFVVDEYSTLEFDLFVGIVQ